MHDNVKYRNDGKDGTLYDDVQGLRRHVQNGIHDDVQGKRIRKTDVQHVRRHVRGVRNGVRKDGRQDGHVQAVRRRMQEMRSGMSKHDEVTSFFIFVYKNSDKNRLVTKKNQIFLFNFVLEMSLIFLFTI